MADENTTEVTESTESNEAVSSSGEETQQYGDDVTKGSENATSPKEASDDDGWGLDIDDLIDEGSDEDIPEEPEEEPKEAAETQETTETSKEETPQTEELEKEKPQEPPKEEERTQQETSQQETQAESSQTPEDINAQYEAFFNQSVDLLEKNVYTFDEETREALDTNPSQVLPKLAAQMHMQVMSAALTQVYNMFPTLLQEHQGKMSAVQEAEDAFYTEYPQLKGHEETVNRIAQVYRQANPKATDRKMIASEVAAMAMVQARIPLPGTQPQQPEPAKVKPVVPTSARGGTTSTPTTANPSEWDELIQEE
jgi:hypothetical protein